MPKSYTHDSTPRSRRSLFAAAGPAALMLAGAAAGAGGAVQAAAQEAAPPLYSTWNPAAQRAFDELHTIVKAQAAGTYIEPPNPDAGLHVLCAEFNRLHALVLVEDNAEWEQAQDARWQVFQRIDEVCPKTEAGHRAKAAVAVAMLAENQCGGEFMGDTDALFALNTLRDWLGIAA